MSILLGLKQDHEASGRRGFYGVRESSRPIAGIPGLNVASIDEEGCDVSERALLI